MKEINDSEFEETIKDGYVLVDAWAEWCGPCRMVGPILEEISKERQDVKIYKLNVDENPKTPTQYGIQSIPTMLLFEDGRLKDKIVGALPKTQINSFLNKNIGASN